MLWDIFLFFCILIKTVFPPHIPHIPSLSFTIRAGASPFGAECAADGGPDTPDETNTSPRSASHGMVYMENASSIVVSNCVLRAAGKDE